MYANFYNKNQKCLFSVEVRNEHEAEHLSDKIFNEYPKVEDWSITEDQPIGILKVF
jgi:hypothetical protein